MTSSDLSPYAALWRMFLAQFFSSDSISSEDDLRGMIVGVVAFLLPPVLFFLVAILPTYEIVVLVATERQLPGLVADMLAWIAFILVTYSMVTVGFIAVCVWDTLGFSRQDAMTLGPLPVRSTTVIVAKLASLAAFLLGSSAAVNLLNAAAFSTTTSHHFGAAGFTRHFAGSMAGTLAAAAFVFGAVVAIRGALTLVGSVRATAVLGSLLQFLFVVALSSLVILISQARTTRPAFLDSSASAWNPTIWFLGLFEYLRGSPNPEWAPLASRAALATLGAIFAAVMVSIAGFHRQMQCALAPQPGLLSGAASIRRTLARWMVGRCPVARGTADFILLTIARNRAPQGPIAINTALGAAVCLAGLSRSAHDLDSLFQPRTAVLWIPLVIAYAIAIGMRASFFVPSDLPASWSFRAHAPAPVVGYWSAVRASMIATVAPAAAALSLAIGVPLLGWRAAAWHTLLVCAVVVLLVELLALTLNAVPFTRAYRPGHANLKTRWPLYAIGLLIFAYLPARLGAGLLNAPASLLRFVGLIGALIVAAEVAGRLRARRWSVEGDEQADEDRWDETLLDIGRVQRGPI